MDQKQRRRLKIETEQWFVSRGMPHFIADYTATGDIWTRAAPFLTFVLFAEVFLTFGDRVSGWAQFATFMAGAVLIVGAFALVNRLRGRRPLSLPDDIGPLELAAFVAVPAVLPVLVNDDAGLENFTATALFNIVLLSVVYAAVSYGIVPLIRWSVVRFFKELGGLVELLGKSLPLLLLFSAFLVLNAEMWQVAHDLPGQFFAVVVIMLVLLGTAFVGLSIRKSNPADVGFESWLDVAHCCEDSPVANVSLPGETHVLNPPPLDRASQRNIGLMQFVGVAIQVLLVAGLITAFYIAFGLLTVRETTIVQWIADDALDKGRDVLWETSLFGDDLVLTRAHLLVAGFVGSFSGLQFAVSVLTDAGYREDFAADVADEIRENLAVRALYHELLVQEPEVA